MDLQDLGYETCGRSENEAEREDASSPGDIDTLQATINKYTQYSWTSMSSLPSEFDDLEMCTSLSNQPHYEGVASSWYAGSRSRDRGAYEMEGEPVSLQRLVQDLRSQLTRCHKVIRGLQLRVRSLSTTSDYASSLERTPRKVAEHEPAAL